MQLILTKHAKERMAEKAITKDMIITAIKMGAQFKQTDGYLASYSYIKVAYKKLGEECYKIKTVYVG